MPAVGVDGGLADLAATLAASALPEPPYRIAIGFSVSDMATSPASRQSALGIVSAECERFVGGRLLPAHPGSAMRLLDLGPPGGVGWVTWIPGVEVLLVPRHLPCEQVDTWLRVPRLVASTLRRTSRVLPTLMRSPLGRAASRLHRWYGRSEPGERRHRTTFRVVVEVRDAAGGLRRVVMSGRDVYGLTGHIAAHGASRLAARRPDAPGGVFTPAQVFAPRPFLDALSPWLSVEVDDG